MTTLFQEHVAKWKGCQQCCLSSQRSKVVITRGKIPCEVLFIGEAPGISEDVLGEPFVGPAGRKLDLIIRESLPPETRYCLTNLVACFPRDAKETDNHTPPEESIRACEARLKEFIAICKPRLVVCVGALSQKWVRKMRPNLGLEDTKLVDIIHPAAILRQNESMQRLSVQKSIVIISSALRSRKEQTC